MNKTERAYADYLYGLQLAEIIVGYSFEGLKFRLAAGTFYTPDFLVVYPNHFEIHEVKGFMRDDAAVKIKVAAQLFPWFRFVLVTRKAGEWVWKPVGIH